MADRSLRGMSIGSKSMETDEGVDFAPRFQAHYDCPNGHTIILPFSTEAEVPVEWECRCGELALLRDYISLQELRFGERISFEMNCDSRCAACELPKFTLQPIVENSIVHGMRSRSAGGRIRIVTESTPNGCRIQITDNGGGFSRSKMKQNTAEGHRSIGLQNIAGRIALSGGSFRIVSCPGLGTTARIILPMKGEEHIC